MQSPSVTESAIEPQRTSPTRSLRQEDVVSHPVDNQHSRSDTDVPSGLEGVRESDVSSVTPSSSTASNNGRSSPENSTKSSPVDAVLSERRVNPLGPLMPARRVMVDEGTNLDDDITEEQRTAKPTEVEVHQNRGPRTGVLLPIKQAWDKMTDLLAVSDV